MAKEELKEKDVESIEMNTSSVFIRNDEKSKRLSKYDKYKSTFDISISNDTVIFKPKYR